MTPFLNVEIDYRITHESEVFGLVTFVEKFHCSFAESVVSIDSDYLVNMAFALDRVRQLFKTKNAGVHPIFMKDSCCDLKDDLIEQLNMDDSRVND
jgi:UDP-galactopyranose mutase